MHQTIFFALFSLSTGINTFRTNGYEKFSSVYSFVNDFEGLLQED